MDVALSTTGGVTAGATAGMDLRQVESGSGEPTTQGAPPTLMSAADAALVAAPLVFAKPVPVIVICVPPVPLAGLTDAIVGPGEALNVNADVAV